MQDKRIRRSKTNIKQAFLHLLKRKHFHDITISEIVEDAGYNRGTFYANFQTKDNLLDEIVHEVLTEMIAQIRNPYKELSKVDLTEMQIHDITLFDYFKDNQAIFKTLLSSHVQIDFQKKMAKAIEQLFLEEYAYELPKQSRIDPKWLYVYRANGIVGVIVRWIEDDFDVSPQFLSIQIVELMLLSTEVFHIKGFQTGSDKNEV